MQSEEAESASKQAHTGKSESIMDTAHQPDAPDAIPGLPNHVIEHHVLRSEYFPDPADFARLQTVSRAMRNAVAATGRPVEPMGWEKASKLGCLSALQRLQRQGNIPPFGKKEVFRWAAYRGDLETMKWAHENYFPMDVDTCNFAAAGGRLEALKWLRAISCPWDEDVFMHAGIYNYLELMQWAHAHGCPWYYQAILLAAARGHLEMVQWAFTDETMRSVVARERESVYGCGNLRVLKWLRANDPLWDARKSKKSAEDAYRYLRDTARQSGEYSFETKPAFLEALRWYEDGCPM